MSSNQSGAVCAEAECPLYNNPRKTCEECEHCGERRYVKWSEDDDGIWSCSGCDISWVFDYGGAKDNGVKYCPKCGGRISEYLTLSVRRIWNEREDLE